MNPAYELFQKLAESNKQWYTLLRFACQCNDVSAITYKNYDSVIPFMAAMNKNIKIYDISDPNEVDFSKVKNMSGSLDINLNLTKYQDKIDSTDLLFFDAPSEGNYAAMQLARVGNNVKKYIVIPNTVLYGHTANPLVQNSNNQTIGVVFGINNFVKTNEQWFILEHDDINPGITILVNKENVK